MGGFRNLRAEVPDTKRGYTFISTTYIYGLAMLAILATLFIDAEYLRGGNVTFYIDNSNCVDSLVRGYTKTAAINRMVKLFWPQVQKLGISVWFRNIPSVFNPADAPTREAALPFPARRQSKFGILEALRIWIESGELSEDQFRQPQNNPHFYRAMVPRKGSFDMR